MFGKKNKDAVYLTYDEKSIFLRALVVNITVRQSRQSGVA